MAGYSLISRTLGITGAIRKNSDYITVKLVATGRRNKTKPIQEMELALIEFFKDNGFAINGVYSNTGLVRKSSKG